MSELLFPTFEMDQFEVQMVTQIYQQLKGRRTAAFDLDITFDLASFESFRYYHVNRVSPVIAFNSGGKPYYLSFPNLTYTLGGGRYSPGMTQECQIWGITYLKGSYDHVLIRTETFLDKIREMLCHTELHFEDDHAFNSKFFVLANDQAKARSAMGPAFRDLFKGLEITDLVVEIIDNMLIIGNNKIVDPDTAEKMVDFLDKMTRLG